MVAPLCDTGPHPDGRAISLSRFRVRNPDAESQPFEPVGWAVFVVLAHAHAFGYLATY